MRPGNFSTVPPSLLSTPGPGSRVRPGNFYSPTESAQRPRAWEQGEAWELFCSPTESAQRPRAREQGEAWELFCSPIQRSRLLLCTYWVPDLVLGRLPAPAAFRLEGQMGQQGRPQGGLAPSNWSLPKRKDP